MFIATLIAAERISSGDISAAEHALRARGIEPMGRSWIEEDVACDLLFSADPATAREALQGLVPGADLVVQGEAGRRKLQAYGIAPPGPAGGTVPLRFMARAPALAIACPRCASQDTERLAAFGSTACKALYR